MALKAWDEKETKQKIGTEKLGIGRSVTYPSRSKSTNSVALAAWDEDTGTPFTCMYVYTTRYIYVYVHM